ncbi:hypothetical protein Q9L42_020170 (plasmid) [Methylomarinum sp. Ch1-1]|uniref:Uncharacterized protein n=1 Tax=Methylomarinum roseum TaxID=3067653 RepID=A0AAU7P059_9GAMM|nr:hypothetical protein [Methylomarinum sp. Ch1-1]MDP4523230.1 hypothetical protein [Methylomarinum sp. Ch1-1]
MNFFLDLTPQEQALIDSLPKPPYSATVQSTNVWIIEWLSPEERRTGYELHCWMGKQRQGWSIYNRCDTKAEVLRSIKRAAYKAQQTGFIPVLHIEAHGGPIGIMPSSKSIEEFIAWEELTKPLQDLNEATKCNLIFVVAACLGLAAVQVLTKGPRAPAVALVGSDEEVNESDLLHGMQEFYRCFRDDDLMLSDIVESASREMISANFYIEPFAILAYESLVEHLIRARRPAERQMKLEKLRQRLRNKTSFSDEEIEKRLAKLPESPLSENLQKAWDCMFMIDLDPKNKVRFGLDWEEIASQIFTCSPT